MPDTSQSHLAMWICMCPPLYGRLPGLVSVVKDSVKPMQAIKKASALSFDLLQVQSKYHT